MFIQKLKKIKSYDDLFAKLFSFIKLYLREGVLNFYKKIFKANFSSETKYFYDKNTTSLLNLIFYKTKKNLDLGFSYTTQNIDYSNRVESYKKIKNIINDELKFEKIKQKENDLEQINLNGYLDSSLFDFQQEDLLNFNKKILKEKKYPGHVIHESLKSNLITMINPTYTCFHPKDILKHREVQKLIFNKDLINFLVNYFDCVPTCGSINCYTQNKKSNIQSVQNFHRDNDDFKTLTYFIFLTDTEKDNGGHEYIRYTHDLEMGNKNINKDKICLINNMINKKYNISIRDYKSLNEFYNLPKNGYEMQDLYNNLSDEKIQLFGKAGKSFMTNNFGLHRAVPPTKNSRTILWISYTLIKNHGYNRYPSRLKFNDIINSLHTGLDDKIIKYIYRNFINYENT